MKTNNPNNRNICQSKVKCIIYYIPLTCAFLVTLCNTVYIQRIRNRINKNSKHVMKSTAEIKPSMSIKPETQQNKKTSFFQKIGSVFRFLGKKLKRFLIALWAIITVAVPIGWISWAREWDQIIKNSAFIEKVIPSWVISRWEDTLGQIRLDESNSYIDSLMGSPPQISEFNSYDVEIDNCSETIEFKKDMYFNSYFTLFCIYIKDSLQGFLVISNRNDFCFTSYRGNLTLCKDTIAGASNKCSRLYSYFTFISGCVSQRLDLNQYYVECQTLHPLGATPYIRIGYGYCDISDMIDMQNIPAMPQSLVDICSEYGRTHSNDKEYFSEINEVKDDVFSFDREKFFEVEEDEDVVSFRNNTLINTFFIFKDNDELIKNALITGTTLGMCKDSYYNLTDNYMQSLEKDFPPEISDP